MYILSEENTNRYGKEHQNRIYLDEKFCISLSKCFCQVEGDCSLNSRYDRINFLANSLSPRHPRQKHLLTVKGLAAYKEIKGQQYSEQKRK